MKATTHIVTCDQLQGMTLSVGNSVQHNSQGMQIGSHGPSHTQQRRAPSPAAMPFAGHGGSSGSPAGQSAEHFVSWQRVLDDAKTEILNQASENEFLRSKVRVMEWHLHNNGAVDGEADADSLDSRQSQAMTPTNEPVAADGGYGGHTGGKQPVGRTRPALPYTDRRRTQSGSASDVASYRPSERDGGPTNTPWQEASPPHTPHSTARPSARNGGELVETGSYQAWSNPGSLQRGMVSGAQPSYHSPVADQDVMVSNGRIRWLEEQLHGRDRLLAAAQVKEAQLLSDKRSLERRVAELRMAYDQQQQGMLEATSQALAYRKEVLDDNVRLAQALERAESDRTVFVGTLMPLMAEFGLHPDANDASELVNAVKLVVQRLLTALSLTRRVPPGLWNDGDPTAGSVLAGLNLPGGPGGALLDQGSMATPGGNAGLPSWLNRQNELRNSDSREASGLDSAVPGSPIEASHRQSSGDAPPNYLQPSRSTSEPTPSLGRPSWTEFVETVRREPLEWQSNGEDSNAGQSSPATQRGSVQGNAENTQKTNPVHNVSAPDPPPPSPPPPAKVSNQQEEENPDSSEVDNSEPPGPALRPAIEGLRIVGDAVLGGKLTACGHSINGTALCVFQWVRQYSDGSAYYIDGAASPEYIITADDCGSIVAIECVPMDDMGNRGVKVRVAANDGQFIQLDAILQEKMEDCLLDGGMSFDVTLLERSEQSLCVLHIKKTEYTLKRGSKKIFRGLFSDDLQVEIQVGQPTLFIINTDVRPLHLDLRDSRQRDMAVLVMRRFKEANTQPPGTRRRNSWFK